MQEYSSEENKSSKKNKIRKRSSRKERKEDEKYEEGNIKKNTEEKNNSPKNEKQKELQKKLKYIFKEVREKGKYEYNRQEIPEHLKYHSDSDSSEQTKISKIDKKKINNDSSRNNNKKSEKKSINLKGYYKNKDINDNKNYDSKDDSNKETKLSSRKKKIETKNKEEAPKKEKKFNNVRDIIEKLKAKKNEKEDLVRLEKEAEEQSIMRAKIQKKNNNNNNEEKINESEIEKEAEKIRQKEKRIEERRIAREKRRKLEEEEKRKKEKEFEEKKKKEEEEIEKRKEEERKKREEKEMKKVSRRKSHEKKDKNLILPSKRFKNEEETSEDMVYISGRKNSNKYKTVKKSHKEKEEEEEKEDEIEENNNNKIIEEDKNLSKKKILNTNIRNKKETLGTYKKPNQKSFANGKTKIYKPKKGLGVIRGRSQDKIDQNLMKKIDVRDKSPFNNKTNLNYALTTMNPKKINDNNCCKTPIITYSKKRSIGSIRENNFVQLNKSFGEFRPNFENGNNFMNGMYNINTLDMGSLPDLNSSFDSRMINHNNYQFNLNNKDLYNRTAQKNYNNSTINSGNITNSSNRFVNMNNLFNLNGLSYFNGENDFINMSNINFNNNNSFYDLLQPQLSPFDLNSSYSIGYNNPLANFTYNNNQVNLSNFLNNNYLGINNMNLNNNFNFNNIIPNPKKNSSINIEDLLVLEEKLSEISNALNKTKIMHNECFEFWNYYFNCSLYGSLEKLFININDSKNVQISINYILMSILICYDCSFDIDILNNVYSVLKDLLNLNHKNLILIYEHILSKISTDNKDNIWVIKLLNIVNSSKNNDYNFNFNEYNNNSINEYTMTLIEKINFNTGIIIQNIRVLLKNYKTPKVEYLTSLFKKINEKSYEDINNFFQQFILRVDNMNGSILASIYLKDNPNLIFKPDPAPYVHTINHKKYTLVLDLDETLVHFKVNPQNDGEGVLKVRPGATEFLDEMDKYYELIVFTGATQDYANLLIDALEENKIYFEHRLYRQHMIIIDNEFVKDLTRIGRPLDKIIIVDNMPQNFRLQKENGINIKSFWGEDIYDTSLINLTNILINIAQEGGDIRKGLEKYRDEIVEKVSSNLSKNDS